MIAAQLKKLLELLAVNVPSSWGEQPLLPPNGSKCDAFGLIKGTPGIWKKRKLPLENGLEDAKALINTGDPDWYRWTPPTCHPPAILLPAPCLRNFFPGPAGSA